MAAVTYLTEMWHRSCNYFWLTKVQKLTSKTFIFSRDTLYVLLDNDIACSMK